MAGRDRPAAITLHARAKLNLGLEVRGKRADGYHEIVSLMQSVDLHDTLTLRRTRGGAIRLRCPGSDLPAGEGNLVVRAARLLRERTGTRLGAAMVLVKRIPVGAGLGGGSSDAAAALVGLNRLWRLERTRAELQSLAAELGSDVPFFIRGGTQLARGRGERLTRLPPLPAMAVAIVQPSLFVSTASIYSSPRIQLTPRGPLSRLRLCDLTSRFGVVSCLSRLRNDLEPAVASRHPKVGRILRELRAVRAGIVRVSGSGSSIFVLAVDLRRLRRILEDAPVSGCRVIWTRFSRRGWVTFVPRGARSRQH